MCPLWGLGNALCFADKLHKLLRVVPLLYNSFKIETIKLTTF